MAMTLATYNDNKRRNSVNDDSSNNDKTNDNNTNHNEQIKVTTKTAAT